MADDRSSGGSPQAGAAPGQATERGDRPEAAAPLGRTARRRRLAAVSAVGAAVAIGAAVWAVIAAGRETTDDAQVEADVVPVSARVAGYVKAIPVVENQKVRKGDLLLELDDAELSAKARQAEGELQVAQAQAQASDAQIGAARAALARTQADARKAGLDLSRDRQLRRSGSVAQDRLDAAEAADQAARAAFDQARANVVAAEANARLAHARAQSAQAALDLSRLDLSYARVVAPTDGEVSRLTARVGQQVSLGQTIGALVPDATYVLANFKETQLAKMREGQRAEVRVDAFSGHPLEARVESFAGGTGSRFSLLPPDNASGNFVKVVQRVPVRIAFARRPDLPLRAGLSCDVTVYVR